MENEKDKTTQSADDWQARNASILKKPDAAQPKNANAAPAPKRKGNGGLIVLVIISLLVGCGGLAVGVISLLSFNKNKLAETTSEEGYYQGNSVQFEETSIASIVTKVTPAVVSIISETRTSGLYSYYYGATQQSAGTGMIVSADGYILTNKHVIEGATKLQVVTDAGDTYDDITIVGTDPLNDVAYIKINNVSDLPTVTLGDSKTIAVGQPVLAIGNALGAYQNSVTQGIISGTGRSLTATDSNGDNPENLSDMIQTDAAINPGNSGGPLVNAAGDVIGINTATSSNADGLGFAIPVSAVKGMLKNIQATGKAERAYLGVSCINITPEVAKDANLPVRQGAYIHSSSTRSSSSVIIKDGPADKAGLKADDIITKIGDVEVGRAGSVSTLIGEYKVGDTIKITYIRDGKTETTTATLQAYKK